MRIERNIGRFREAVYSYRILPIREGQTVDPLMESMVDGFAAVADAGVVAKD